MKNGIPSFGVVGVSLLISAITSMAQSAPTASTNATTNPAPPTPATAAPTATVGKATQKMEPIIVTGSNIPTTDTEGASPVAVIDSATIEKRGYQTATDILQNLPANGSFSNPGKTSGNFAAGAAYASLRGLGPQATLVLINGRRVADYAAPANGQYAFVDLNSIPAAIIDRVEVLTESTSIYGADAIAGVINIITKTNLGGDDAEVNAYWGNTTNKDAFEQRYSTLGNLSSFDKNGYGVVEADFEHENSIFAGDRQISQTANQSVNGGIDLRSSRTYPGKFIAADGTAFSILPGTGNVPLTGVTNAADPNVDDGAANLQHFDFNPYTSIQPETERYGTYLNYSYKFYDGNITPHVDFDWRHNWTELTQAPGGWRSSLDGIDGSLPGQFFTVPTTNPYNQTGQVISIDRYRFVDMGPRIEDVTQDLYRVVPSVDFKIADGWTLNLGLNFNYSYLNDENFNFPSATAFQNALNGTTLATAYNPFTNGGSNNANVINSIRANSYNNDSTSIMGQDFRFNGTVYDLPAGPVQVSFGGEYRLERYNQTYGAADASGDVLSSSTQLDTAASQKSLSGYAEVDIPITSPAFNCPGFYSMDVDVAGRVDQYSQFGHTENPNIRLRWEVVPGLVVRGSYATSFRAPSLPELAAGGNQAVTEIVDPADGQFKDVEINSTGNANLKPETAESFSGGVAYSPEFVKGLLVTADFFKIRYDNQIEQTDPQGLVDGTIPQSPGNTVLRNPVDGTVEQITASYINTLNSYIQGIDAGFSYVLGDPNIDWGQLTFALNATWLLNYKTDSGNGLTENVGEDSAGVGPYSRYRQDVDVTWDYRNLSFTVSNDFASGYNDTIFEQYDGGNTRQVASNVTFNLQASYTFDKDIQKIAPGPKGAIVDWRQVLAGTKFTLGCNNVYDFQPPFTGSQYATLGYDPTYADPTGRFVYAALSKKF